MAGLNLSTDVTNEWLIKRLAISATHHFANQPSYKRSIRANLNASPGLNTAEDMRQALKIPFGEWLRFLDVFFKEGGVVRQFGANRDYRDLQAAYRLERELAKGEKEEIERLLQEFMKKKPGPDAPVPPGSDRTDGLHDDPLDVFKETDADPEVDKLRGELQAARSQIGELRQQLHSEEDRKVVDIILKRTPSDKEPRRVSMVHKTMPELLVRVQCDLNVYLVGPAGSGKTTGAEQVASALELPFGFMSVGPQTTKSDVFGYMNATGSYVETEFRRRYEHGGVFLFDEIDAAHAGVLTQINAALAGSMAAFPDKMVKKHEDFRCIAAGNTYGTGPDRVYVGRNELDGASLDRFDMLEWAYDEALEAEIAKTLSSDEELVASWVSFVQQFRRSVQKLGIRHVVSPRATINGVKLLSAGVDVKRVRQTTVYKSLKPQEIDRITSNF